MLQIDLNTIIKIYVAPIKKTNKNNKNKNSSANKNPVYVKLTQNLYGYHRIPLVRWSLHKYKCL